MKIVKPQPIFDDQIAVNVAENEAPLWADEAIFGVGAEVIRHHKVFVSTIADNQGNDPLLEDQTLTSVRWLFKSFTGAHAFRDGVLSNKTEKATTLRIDFDNLDSFDAVVLFGLVGSELLVRGYSADGEQLLRRKVTLSGRIVAGWHDWLNKDFGSYSSKIIVGDMPASVSMLRVEVRGANVAVGEIVLGDLVDLGVTQVDGTSGQSVPMSTVDFNRYGVLKLVKRPTRTEMTYRVFASGQKFDAVKPILDDLQGQVVAAIGSAERPSTINLGVLGSLKWSEDMHDGHFFSLILRGVI